MDNTQLAPLPASMLSPDQFRMLSDIPPEIEWFANLRNPNTRRNYEFDIKQFTAFAGIETPDQLRAVSRAHVIAWRDHLAGLGLSNDTVRRKLAALSSLYAYLCDHNLTVPTCSISPKYLKLLKRGHENASRESRPTPLLASICA